MEDRYWYAKRSAARALDMSVRNLERHIARGSLSVRRCGRKVYIPAESLEDFAQRDHPAPIVTDDRAAVAKRQRQAAPPVAVPFATQEARY